MADLDRENVGQPLVRPDVPLAAGVVVYVGDILVRDVTGYARPRASAALLATDRCCGVATEAKDNTLGAAGALRVACDYHRAIWLSNSSTSAVVVADSQCYVYDRTYVCGFRSAGIPSASINVPCGEVLEVDSAKGVLVLVGAISQHDADRRIEVLEGY